MLYFAGFSLTTTPGKAGELIRSLFLKPYGVQFHHSAAMFFSERLADLVAIVALTAIGFTHLPGGTAYFVILVSALFAALLLLRAARVDVASTGGRRSAGRAAPWRAPASSPSSRLPCSPSAGCRAGTRTPT